MIWPICHLHVSFCPIFSSENGHIIYQIWLKAQALSFVTWQTRCEMSNKWTTNKRSTGIKSFTIMKWNSIRTEHEYELMLYKNSSLFLWNFEWIVTHHCRGHWFNWNRRDEIICNKVCVVVVCCDMTPGETCSCDFPQITQLKIAGIRCYI